MNESTDYKCSMKSEAITEDDPSYKYYDKWL